MIYIEVIIDLVKGWEDLPPEEFQEQLKSFYLGDVSEEFPNQDIDATRAFVDYLADDCDVDYEQAYKYFTMAALCGEIEALYKVGDMFRYGYYVKKSEHTAFVLYNRALSMFTDAEDCRCGGNIMKRMGDVFCEGIGVDINYDTALMFYQRAEGLFYSQIRNGDPFADKDLEYAIKMQAKLRKAVAKTLPKRDWEVK